jgi:hypothetical protein
VAHLQALTDVQERALGGLRENGIAIVPFAELIADDGLWEALKADVDAFVGDAESELEHGGGAKRKKDNLIRRYPRRKKLPR